jgi:hypothetical protein
MNEFYVNAKNLMLGNGTHTLIDWDTDTIKVCLVDSADYTVNLSSHQDIADVAAGARVSTATLAGKAISAGVFDCTDPSFSTVTGDQSEALVFWKDSGVESTSTLGLYIDTVTSGLPVTPNGGNITVTINASGLFTL